jgi:hypothetical protein
MDRIDYVAEEFDANGNSLVRSRKNFDDVASGAKRTTMKIDIVAGILDFDKLG